MNYLVQTKEGKFIVVKSSKDWTTHINSGTYLSIGKESFKVIQEIEIR